MINLVKNLKSVIAVIVFSMGALVASQAHAYTYDDYDNAVIQVFNAQLEVYHLEGEIGATSAELDALEMQGDANYAMAHCNSNNMNQYQYNDCINGYMQEFSDKVDNLNNTLSSLYGSLGMAYYGLSQAETTRDEIAIALGL